MVKLVYANYKKEAVYNNKMKKNNSVGTPIRHIVWSIYECSCGGTISIDCDISYHFKNDRWVSVNHFECDECLYKNDIEK